MKLNREILAAVALASMAMPANASVIYDNGAPNTTNGNEATQWVQAEDFSFVGGTTVGGAGVYIAGLAGNIAAWDGNFTYVIFANSGGMPGSPLQTGNVSVSPVDTGLPAFKGNSYLFAFDFLSPFDAVAGTTYWLGIHLSSNFNRDEIYWVTSGGNTTARGEENDGGMLNVWFSNDQEHAFYLTDSTSSAVPEPAPWAMMLVGFGVAGLALRRGRRPKLATA
jgi:hypothetical protein